MVEVHYSGISLSQLDIILTITEYFLVQQHY